MAKRLADYERDFISTIYGDGDLCTVEHLAEVFNVSVSTIRRVIKAERRSPVEPESLTVGQVAVFLNVGENTVYRLCKNGDIVHHRIGSGRGTIRITRENLRQYLSRRQVEYQPSEIVEDFLGLP